MFQIVSNVYGAERSPHTVYTCTCYPVQTGAQRSGNSSFKEPNQTPQVIKQSNVVMFNFKELKIVEN